MIKIRGIIALLVFLQFSIVGVAQCWAQVAPQTQNHHSRQLRHRVLKPRSFSPNVTAQGLKSLSPAGNMLNTDTFPLCQVVGGCGITDPLVVGNAGAFAAFVQGKTDAYQIVPLVGTTFTPNLALGTNMVMNLNSGCTPCTLAAPTNLVVGMNGVIRINQSGTGGGTLVPSGSVYANNPYPFPVDADSNSPTDWFWDVDAVGNFVLREWLYPPTINNALAPNLLTGGNGMTSNWTSTGGTLTTGAGTDPLGGGTAAGFIEDSSNGTHRVSQAFSGASLGTNTMSCFVKIAVGTRWTECSFANNTISDRVNVVLNTPGGCVGTSLTTGVTGAASVSNSGVIPRSGGWCEFWVQGTLGGSTPLYFLYELNNAGTDFYAGDGVSGNYFWLPKISVGANSPP